jgi:adenosylcobinamide-GDP ribazoletransferase
VGPHRAALPAALVLLFLIQAQRILLGTAAAWPGPGLLWITAAILLPLIPVPRRARGRELVWLAATAAVLRLVALAPTPEIRFPAAAALVACAALFLGRAVGRVAPTTLAAAYGVAVAADQLLVVVGASLDPSLGPWWWPAQLALSATLAATAAAWLRPDPAAPPRTGERRASGLRLRAGVALGALLFMDLHLLGAPAVVARLARLSFEAGAMATGLGTGVALAVLAVGAVGRWARWHAPVLGMVAGTAALVGWWAAGPGVLAGLAAGHAAAILLMARVLEPAGGRRGGFGVAACLLILLVAGLAFGFTGSGSVALAVVAAAMVAAIGAAAVLPRGGGVPPDRLPNPWVVVALATPPVAVAAVAWLVVPPAPDPVVPRQPDGTVWEAGPVRVATLDVGGPGRAMGPGDVRRVTEWIETAAPDVVALHGAAAGLATAYGVDWGVWLERRVGAPVFFSAGDHPLHGVATLARVPTLEVRSVGLGPGRADGQILRVHALPGGRSVFFDALDLGADPGPSVLDGLAGSLGSVRAVVLVTPNGRVHPEVARALAAAGFSEPGAGARGIWVRGFQVLDPGPMDLSPPFGADATLQMPAGDVR